jgi:glycosyltransferase involved in cell wall biosynthesis
VVYSGGLLPWKGVDVVVDVARSLPECTFLIVGGMDADVERLRRSPRTPKNVRLAGFQPPARVVDYLVAADAGVVPNRAKPEISARYTSPLKVFEAMAVGLPLVVSDLPSLREILRPDEDALFVTPDDATSLRLALEKLFRSDELRQRLRANLRARAPEHTWDARARRLLEWMAARTTSHPWHRGPRA